MVSCKAKCRRGVQVGDIFGPENIEEKKPMDFVCLIQSLIFSPQSLNLFLTILPEQMANTRNDHFDCKMFTKEITQINFYLFYGTYEGKSMLFWKVMFKSPVHVFHASF